MISRLVSPLENPGYAYIISKFLKWLLFTKRYFSPFSPHYFAFDDKCTRRQKSLPQSELIKHWIVLEVFIFPIIPVAKYSFGEGFTSLNSRSRIKFQIEPNVLKWNVEKIPVSRMKRYKDKANLARVRSNLTKWQNTHWWRQLSTIVYCLNRYFIISNSHF